MEKAIIGRKIGMSQIFDEAGKVIPVTVIEAGPCVVVQKKTEEKDGYNAVQLGFQDVPERKLTKPEQGHLKKAEVPMKKVLKEFKLDKAAEMNVGDEIKADTFAKGDHIDVTGISKGKGFQGVIKRWNAGRGRMTHGGGPVHRHAGSMGSGTDPSRIFKGKIGAGHHRGGVRMKTAYDIIRRPVITEQSMADTENKKYVFEVSKDATKIEIAKAVEEIFGVKVIKVNTLNVTGKLKRTGRYPAGRRPSWKKAVVTLSDDSKSIEFFEGMA